MKTAVCFTGTGRSLQHTHQNLKDVLIGNLGDCDVFILVSDNPHSNKAREFFETAPQLKKILIEKEPEYDITKLRFRSSWPSGALSSRQIYIKMIESRKRCNQLLSSYEKENNIVYDRVVFSRLDVKYFKNDWGWDTLNNLNLNQLYVPDFHNTFGGVVNGYNDRFALSNRSNMGAYFHIPDSIDNFLKTGQSIHAETLLKWHLEQHGISVKKIPLRFTRVRPDGEEIDLRLKDTSNLNLSDT